MPPRVRADKRAARTVPRRAVTGGVEIIAPAVEPLEEIVEMMIDLLGPAPVALANQGACSEPAALSRQG